MLVAEPNAGKSPLFRQSLAPGSFLRPTVWLPVFSGRFALLFASAGPGTDKPLFVQNCTNSILLAA